MKNLKKIILVLLLLLAAFTAGCSINSGQKQLENISTAQEEVPLSSEASVLSVEAEKSVAEGSYPVVDTGQGKCYDNSAEVTCPTEGQSFYGQDAQYDGNTPDYTDNGDGTITDNVTGLMWQQDPGTKMTFNQAVAGAESFNLAKHSDWRLPTIKELYSLILLDGTDVSICISGSSCSATPFINTNYFIFEYGDTDFGERLIDSQFATSTQYVSTTMNGNETMFGVNFADGRIKGYPTGPMPGESEGKLFFVLYVRDNPGYGQNSFMDNGDGTVTDNTTSLTWGQSDSGTSMNWSDALVYCEASSEAGYDDWRLPDVKELQSIVDYSRSPNTTNSAAIDPIFGVTSIIGEAGISDFPFYWSSTTHVDSSGRGTSAAYVAFGEALGYMNNAWIDVHGAGAQRSDPKTGSASDYLTGHGPQGDAVRIDNYARCVRGGNVTLDVDGNSTATRPSMTIESTGVQQNPAGGMPDQSSEQRPDGAPPIGQGSQGGGESPHEALEACVELSEGAVCSMVTPHGALSVIFANIQSQLACVPVRNGQQPPPERIQP